VSGAPAVAVDPGAGVARRPAVTSGATVAWAAAGAVVLLTAVAQAVVLAADAMPLRTGLVDGLNAVVLAGAGAVLWRRAATRTGALLVLAGATLGINNLVYLHDDAVLRTIGVVALPAFVAPLGAALLAFPGGRLRRRDGTVLLGAALLTTVGWWLALLAYAPPPGCAPCPEDPLPGVGGREQWEVLAPVHGGLCALVGLYVATALVRRWRRSSPAARRVRAPVMVAGALTCAVVGVAGPFGYAVVDGQVAPLAVAVAWGLGFAAVPAAMLVALLRQRTARLQLPDLLRALDGAPGEEGLRSALAAALGDPTVEVVRRDPGGGWRHDGRPADLAGGGRAVTPLGRGTDTGILHDAALLEEPALVAAVAQAAALALEHEALRGELRVQLQEARAVRARIVEASDEARRRIERDLHDGAQQTLVSLALALSMLSEELEGEGGELASRLIRHAIRQADGALEELRDVARGVFPALLSHAGLPPALEELARRAPIPVGLDLDLAARAEPAVEAAAYFLVREALAVASAEGAAERAVVRARRRAEVLEIEVLHDGAPTLPEQGLGELADRVAALGGSLVAGDGEAGGRRVAARLPAGPTPSARPAASSPTAVPSG
jgi:signal transduction histidine kinase